MVSAESRYSTEAITSNGSPISLSGKRKKRWNIRSLIHSISPFKRSINSGHFDSVHSTNDDDIEFAGIPLEQDMPLNHRSISSRESDSGETLQTVKEILEFYEQENWGDVWKRIYSAELLAHDADSNDEPSTPLMTKESKFSNISSGSSPSMSLSSSTESIAQQQSNSPESVNESESPDPPSSLVLSPKLSSTENEQWGELSTKFSTPSHSFDNRSSMYEEQLKQLLDGLRRIDLSRDIYDQTEHFNAHGGSSDVFWAKSRRHGHIPVAIKRLRFYVFRNKNASKMIFRELRVWSALHHPNILPLLGYVMHGNYPALVSKWMVNGSARDYIDRNTEFSKLQMSKGIAEGLAYLHNQQILHSDLKSDNIFISDKGKPLLADFGISRIMTATCTTTTNSVKGSTRWMAVELWPSSLEQDDEKGNHSKETDIWAFGMVVYELLTRRLPFYEITNDVRVSFAIANGHLPSRPLSLNGAEEQSLWSLCEECWRTVPRARPDITSICERLS